MPLDLLATLRELIATPSVNPMGRSVSGPEYFEARLTNYLEQLAAKHSLPSWRQTVALQRDNLLIRVAGSPTIDQGGGFLLLEAHQDTVPVDGMTIAPFDPQLRDGRMYGRGSCDIKGGLTAMLAAVVRLAEEQPQPRPTVVLACTVNEEHGFTGASALCGLWNREADLSRDVGHPHLATASPRGPGPLSVGEGEMPIRIIPRAPDAAIVAEPTNLRVVVAHKGMVRWRCHALGRAAHSSRPQQGDNAIFRMARVLAALERYQTEVVGALAEHPLCGRPTLSVGTIGGGLSVNTVPDRCTIEIDRRLVPGEDPKTAWQKVVDFVAHETQLSAQLQHDPPFMRSPGLSDENNDFVAARLQATNRTITGRDEPPIGVSFGTDAAVIGAAGVPCVVFGPGSIAQAHTAEEWVPVAEVEQASEALYRLIVDWQSAPALSR
jgi:acetylornithine deacetylase/succinyl-diaminopimelate desuccinylase-like protein